MRPTRLQPRAVTPSQSRRDVVRGGRQVAKPGVAARQVLNPSGEFAYGAGPGVSAQGQIHGVSGAEIDEVCRGEDGPRAVLANPGQYLGVHGGSLLAHVLTEI